MLRKVCYSLHRSACPNQVDSPRPAALIASQGLFFLAGEPWPDTQQKGNQGKAYRRAGGRQDPRSENFQRTTKGKGFEGRRDPDALPAGPAGLPGSARPVPGGIPPATGRNTGRTGLAAVNRNGPPWPGARYVLPPGLNSCRAPGGKTMGLEGGPTTGATRKGKEGRGGPGIRTGQPHRQPKATGRHRQRGRSQWQHAPDGRRRRS